MKLSSTDTPVLHESQSRLNDGLGGYKGNKDTHLHELYCYWIVNLRSGWFAITTPVVGQMCHVKEVGYWFCFPVKHLVAVWREERDKQVVIYLFFVLVYGNIHTRAYTDPPYHALSLKEMGAVPGGAFRAF